MRKRLHQNTFLLSYETAKFFRERNRISAFRLYLVIKDLYGGNIHLHQFKEIASLLGVKQIHKNFNQLVELGILRNQHTNGGWYKLTNRSLFAPSNHNASREICLEELKNLSTLRTLIYFKSIKTAVHYVRKNRTKNSKSYKDNRPGEYDISSSFLKACSREPYSVQTLSRQVRKLAEKGYISIRQKTEKIFTGTLSECLSYKKYMTNIGNTLLRPLSSSLFSLIKYFPLKIQLK
jgi:hypothetical protein